MKTEMITSKLTGRLIAGAEAATFVGRLIAGGALLVVFFRPLDLADDLDLTLFQPSSSSTNAVNWSAR